MDLNAWSTNFWQRVELPWNRTFHWYLWEGFWKLIERAFGHHLHQRARHSTAFCAQPAGREGSPSRSSTPEHRGESSTFSPISLWRGTARSTQGIQSVEQLGQRSSGCHLYQGARQLHSLLCKDRARRELVSQELQALRKDKLQLETARPTNTRDSQMVKGKHNNPTHWN